MEPERVQKRLATLTAEDMKWLPAGDESTIHLYVPKTQAKRLTISIGFADGTVLQKTIDRFQ